jgi:Nitrile hydratase, alpha chain
MSEATGRAEIERRLIARSLEDEAFRQRLIEDPKAVVEEELGTRLPDNIEIRAVEEIADTIYLVLPSASPLVGEGGEIPDQELETVAGGDSNLTEGGWTCSPSSTCQTQYSTCGTDCTG